MSQVCVVGVGAGGSHAARQLRFSGVSLSVTDADRAQLTRVLDALDGDAERGEPRGQTADVVILAMPAGDHAAIAAEAVRTGASVVSISDDPGDVAALLELDSLAVEHSSSVLVGVGFAPGFSCLLALLAAESLDSVEEIAVSKSGTGGPACARQHHWSLKNPGEEWRDGQWLLQRGGSGRELVWFPEPLGAMDCYRAALPSPRLLQAAFPTAARLSARLGATRRDRLTMRLPMLRRPHADGGPGGVRVEIRGTNQRGYCTEVYGAMHHPSAATGITAAVAALKLSEGALRPGAGGLAAMVDDPKPWLLELSRRGLTAARFSGSLS